MYAKNFICVCLLLGSCSHDGLQMVVTAQPTVSAWIATPVADRKEGERVDVICVARNLNTSHLVEWRTEDPLRTLRWGTESSLRPRFTFTTIGAGTGETTQEFTIDPLERGDTDEYVCNVRDTSQSHSIVATARVTLSVLYFPSDSFPICSPDGYITVDNGTKLNLRCSSEGGNSAVMMTVSENTTRCDTYMWTNSTINDRIEMSLTMTYVADSDNNTSFECTISSVYYPGMTRSCSIGSIRVTGATDSPPRCSTVVSGQATTLETEINPTPSAQSASNTAIIAGASAGGVAALVIILILILICRRRSFHSNNHTKTRVDNEMEVTIRRADTSLDGTTEQMHNNPVFESTGQETTPEPVWDNTGAVSKPTAAVSPTMKQPRKPQPYKPKAHHAEDHHDGNADPDHVIATDPIINGHSDLRNEAYSPSDKISYAQISVPDNHQSTTRHDQPSTNQLLYADLDLQSDPPGDSGQLSEEVMYARVMKE